MVATATEIDNMAQDASLKDLYSALDPQVKGRIKNKIYDFANLDKGTMTVPDPMSPYAKDTIEMSPVQFLSTYDKDFKKRNPEYAALNAYYHPYQSDRSLGYVLGNKLNSLYRGYEPLIGRIMDRGPLAGGLLSAAPGLVFGALGTGALNMLLGRPTGEGLLRNALLGGLATGSLGAYSGYLRKYKPEFDTEPPPRILGSDERSKLFSAAREQARAAIKGASVKRAFASASEAQARIVQAIQNSPGLSFQEKSQLIAGVAQLGSNDLTQLASSLAGYGGATVGAIVARFLLNKGLIGTVLGAIFGGALASSIFGSRVSRNDLGRPSFQGRAITGQFL
jgi:hypothetical protein